ncbi:YtxH domain-containing protein [Candidatus Peregrinibacteria bacterium]|nr:YtxH domain-containing protein [Candidatus Peregrinibacteria bacterium]
MKLGRYIVGLVSGLTFGILFAPKKGKKLREELIKKRGESGQEALMALFNAFKDAGVDAAQEIKKLSENEQLRSALNMSKEKMHEYLSDIEERGYDLAARAQDKVEEFSDMAVAAGTEFKKRAVQKRAVVERAVKNRMSGITKAIKPKAKRTRRTAAKTTVSRKRATGRKKSAPKKKA